MPRPSRLLWTVVIWACLFLLFFPSRQVSAAPRAVATVIAMRGALTVQSRGVGPFLPLGPQAALSAGDVIHTGPDGEAALLFRDGQQIKLNANSSLRITGSTPARREQSLFQALLGVIWAHLRPGQKVEAPSANVVVRGTEILLDVTPNGTTTLTVTEGDASFFNTQGTVEVTAGQRSIARPGQAPTPPVAVDVSGLIAWTADVVGLPLEFEMPPSPPGLPDAAGVFVRLGQVKRRQGDLPGALAAFAEAERLSPDNGEARVGTALTYLSQGRMTEARAALEPVRGLATALAVLGLADLHGGSSADAVRNLKAALAQDPKLAPARALLALAYLTRNARPDAEREAREAVTQQPDSAQTEGTLAMVLFFEGQLKAAEAASRQAVRLNPQSPFALLAEGRALLAQQQPDAARTAYENAAALAPYLWLVHQELGLVYLRLDMPKKAAEEYRIALIRNSASSDAHTGLGLALERQGLFAEAEREHRQAITLDPNNVAAHGNLAALLIARGRLDEARLELETGVRTAPDRGILYARLAELSLYRQDLFAAQEFARRAVRLLPDSAVAHYELGRVYLEQERTVQAEQEFRQATTLDRQFAAARFALGLTEETAEAGRDPSQPLGAIAAASQSGASGALNIQNLQTAGAEERIQAAIQDPTVVRVASRSFGDAQIDTRVGDGGTRDFDLSYLHDTNDQRGEAGLNAQHLRDDGVRANAGTTDERAGILFGDKAADNPSGFFAQGQYVHETFGGDVGLDSTPTGASQRIETKVLYGLIGYNLQHGDNQRTRFLLQTDQPNQDITDLNGILHTSGRSVHGEIRHDMQLSQHNLLSAGVSEGYRLFRADVVAFPIPDIGFPGLQFSGATTLRTLQAYLRDESQFSKQVTLTGEIRIERLDEQIHLEFPTSPDSGISAPTHTQTTVGRPTIIFAYQPNVRSGVRLRARKLFGTVQDFELLAPRDVFLFSFDDVPTLQITGQGESYELEYDYTFLNSSFLRLGAFQQSLQNAVNANDDQLTHVRFRSMQIRYEGILTPTTTFFVAGNVNDAKGVVDYGAGVGTGINESLSLIPRYSVEVGLQFLDRLGWFVQPAYAYQGSRLEPADNPGDPRVEIGSFGVFNARVGKRWGLRSSVFLEVVNAFNKKYSVLGGVAERLEPGRQVRVGASFRF